MNPKLQSGLLALMAGVALNYIGDRILGVKIELFWGLSTFSFAWILDVFFLPFLVGLLVAWVYGKGAKWLSYFPPLIVRCISYAQILYFTGAPHGSNLNPMGWWGLYVILAMESAGIGGILGEVIIKNVYGRSNMIATANPETPLAKKES
jgi:hypothetical protein